MYGHSFCPYTCFLMTTGQTIYEHFSNSPLMNCFVKCLEATVVNRRYIDKLHLNCSPNKKSSKAEFESMNTSKIRQTHAVKAEYRYW